MADHATTEHLSLSAFIAPLRSAVNSVAQPKWVAAEIAEVRGDTHAFVSLIETGANGELVAKLSAKIWADRKALLYSRFTEATGGETLRKGLKILVQIRPSLHPLFGLQASIEDIDPTFTLGAAARKLIELRKRLIEEGSYERQRLLPPPTDFTSVAIIAPGDAAGAGDFRSHADPLEKAGLCRFRYLTALFQGERASSEIVGALRTVYRENTATPFDAVIILRGGGSQADLAWLNDYAIADAVSKMKIPVLVAVGHERDKGILDEIAGMSFHTPSKAIGYIYDCIKQGAQAAQTAFDFILSGADNTRKSFSQELEHAHDSIRTAARHLLSKAAETTANNHRSITADTRHVVELALASLERDIPLLKDCSLARIEASQKAIDSDVYAVRSGADSAATRVGDRIRDSLQTIHSNATKDVAVATISIEDHRLLIRDGSYRDCARAGKDVADVAARIREASLNDIDKAATAATGRLELIRDRSVLATRTMGTHLTASAEYVLGLGPEKTLQRGFVIARNRDGKPATRKNQLGTGAHIQLQFADGNVGATIE
jgi:exodeoxyribonuclease VII large subunit